MKKYSISYLGANKGLAMKALFNLRGKMASCFARRSIRFLNLNKFRSLSLCIIVLIFLNIGCSNPQGNPSKSEKPNIILIMIDNVGYNEIGATGNELVKTPTLDKFAKEGVQFTRFYANQLCAPTRASLMTGRYHYRTGVIHTSRGGAKMHGDEVTIAELLKNEGYTTGLFGKWHMGDNYPMRPQDQGFDKTLFHKSGYLGQVPDKPNTYINPKLWEDGEYVQKEGYCTDIYFNGAIDFIKKNKNKPFFIYLPTNVAHTTTHSGLQVLKKYSMPYISKGIGEEEATVCGMLDNFDENFGQLTSTLDSLGLSGNTVVIFLSDDGDTNRAGLSKKEDYTPYENCIHVPCFVQWTGHFEGGLEVNKLASHIDILPTILEISGIKAPSGLKVDGVSLLPLLEDNTQDWKGRKLFMQLERGIEPHKYVNIAVIDEKYKLIAYYPGSPDGGWVGKAPGKPVFELYDIQSDPDEVTNLARQKPDIVEGLKSAYDKWYDDVKSTRQFTPGIIHIGSEAENPVYLSRYQDATYLGGKPIGWPVFIEREGKYEIEINRGGSMGKGKLVVQCGTLFFTTPLGEQEEKASFHLPSGNVTFNAWVEEQGKVYAPRAEQDLTGDIVIKYIKEDK